MKKWIIGLITTGAAILVMHGQQPADNAAEGRPAVPGELLVQFRAGAAANDRGRAVGRIGAEIREVVAGQDSYGRGELVLVRYRPDVNPSAARRAIASDPAVEFAEPNWIYSHQAVSNDPYYTGGSLWGMYGDGTSPANQYGSQSGEAWAAGKTNCSSVYIGIIDEGYMYTHEDLAANAGKNPGEVPGDGIDNDRNGYIDDVYGWDFDGNNNSVFDGTGDDHGTHVAGTIGGDGGNGRGVAGVCWRVKLISAKFLGRNGGTTANAIRAVDYLTDLKIRHGINLVATNNSWGGGGFSRGLQDAIERANRANILFIAAAGNGGRDGVGDNNDTTANYPSNYPNSNVIAVASITSSGARSSFSNYGPATVDIGAPGSGIVSTVPVSSRGSIVSGYASYSGTSMATPHVTGAAALYAATHPGAAAQTIKHAILDSGVPTPSLAGKTVSGGRLNVSGF